MPSSFTDRFGGSALVTGASAGIGEAFAKAIAARGMDLVLVARRRERLEDLARALAAAHGVRVETVALDLSAPGATEELDRQVRMLGLHIGLLVASAGFGTYGPFLDCDPKFESQMVDLNCRAVVEQCHAFIPAMVERRRGGVILLSSIGGYQPCPYWATYGATKAFVLMLGEALWAELRPLGIEVLALSPGNTATEFHRVAHSSGIGSQATAEEVALHALRSIGRKPSTVHGTANWAMVNGSRFSPRRVAALLSAWMSDPRRRKVAAGR